MSKAHNNPRAPGVKRSLACQIHASHEDVGVPGEGLCGEEPAVGKPPDADACLRQPSQRPDAAVSVATAGKQGAGEERA